ncbi:MAG: beta-lactamase family protein [Gemmatimonadetes bacterium]|nr:beta-lactamase family protein [Gemmatimonadota bacterium]
MRPSFLLRLAAATAFAACGGTPKAMDDVAADAIQTSVPAAATVTVPALDVDSVDALIRRVVADKGLVGLSVGVMQDGKVVLARGYGYRSLDPRLPVTPTTMFGIGSVTKQFTCSAALLLEQDGKLSMNDKVAKYVPTATRANDITLLELGQHVAGYRDYYPPDFVVREMAKPEPTDSVIARYATRPLDFEPGSRWSYSNTGFLILGKAIEQASGMPLATLLQERIFTPAGMSRTAFDRVPGDTNTATGYTSYALAESTPVSPEAEGWIGAAGAIWSTPTDLLAWDLALIEGKVLSASSFNTLTSPRLLTDGRETTYGCGLGIQRTGDALIYSHGGGIAGVVTQNVVIPSTRSAIVTLANADFAATGEIISTLIARLTPHVDVPAIAGLPALEAAKGFLTSVERGTVDRSTLGDDLNALLTDEHLARDRASLAAHGRVSNVVVTRSVERGGMEVAQLQYMVGSIRARTAMYRSPDGKIQQFLINRQ